MSLFKKKPDPLSQKERALSAEIKAVENQIRQLSTAGEPARSQPRLRSTALPGDRQGVPSPPDPDAARRRSAEAASEHKSRDSGARNGPGSWWQRLRDQFRRPPPVNPKLVNYLAAGSIHGLRPLRYEKRIARNRAFVYCLCLLLMLYLLYRLIL